MPALLRAAALAVAFVVLAPRLAAQRVATDTLVLTLEQAVALALQGADEARLADLQVDLAEAQIATARATGLPQLRASHAYSQVVDNARATIVGNVFGQSYNYSANFNVQQVVFQGGRVLAGTRAAARARGAARLSADEVRAALRVDVQAAYLDAVVAERVAEIQEDQRALADARLRQVEQLAAAGRAARFDQLRARVERANLEPAALQAQANRELAMLQLRRLLNLPTDRPVVLATRTPQAVAAVARLVSDAPVAAPASAAPPPTTRAAVRAAELTLQARRDGVAAARADFLPTITVFFQQGVLALPTSAGFPLLWGRTANEFCPPGSPATRVCQNNGWFPDRLFGLNFTWQLFDGLRSKGAMDAAQAQARIAEVQLRQQREAVALEVAAARAELARAQAAYAAQRDNAAQAREAYQLAALRLTRGVGTALESSDAQFQLLTAETNEARAVRDVLVAIADLARAEGRPVPIVVPGPAGRATASDLDAPPR